MTETAPPYLRPLLLDDGLRMWAAELIPAATIEAIIAWLHAGCPAPEHAADTIGAIIDAISQAGRSVEP